MAAILGFLPLLMILTACAEEKPLPADVLARWQGGEINRAELDDFALTLPAKEREPGEGQSLAEWREGLVHKMAARHLLIKRQAASDDGNARLSSYLSALRDQALAEGLATEILAGVAPPTEEAVKAFYDENRGRFRRQELLNLRHIYLRFRAEDGEAEKRQKRDLMAELRRRAKSGEDFGALAREYSESAGAAENGGALELFARGHSFPAFEEAAFSLEEGETSEVLVSKRGVHLVYLDTRLPEVDQSFDEAFDAIFGHLGQSRGEEALAAAEQELSASFEGEMHIEKLDPQSPPHPSTEVLRVGERSLEMEVFEQLFPRWRQLAAAGNLEKILTDYRRQMIFASEAENRGFNELQPMIDRIEAAQDNVFFARGQEETLRRHAEALGEGELREFYDAHPSLFQSPRKIETRRIFLPSEVQELYPTFLFAEELVARLRAGDDFAELAREHSKEPLAAEGGRLPPLAQKGLAAHGKEFYNGVARLSPGEVSDPILVPHSVLSQGPAGHLVGGILIVRVEAIEEPHELGYEESKARIRSLYVRKFSRRILEAAAQELVDSAELQLNREALEAP